MSETSPANLEAEIGRLGLENDALRLRLEESEQALEAIRTGQAESLVVEGPSGPRIFSLEGADHAYRVLVEAMNEGAATLAEDGTILYCNSRFAEMLDAPLERVMGAPIAEYLRGGSKRTFEALVREAGSGEARVELELQSRGGDAIPALVSLSVILEDGSQRLCLVAADLRAQRRSEEVVASERLAGLVLEQAADAVVVCDETGRIIRLSRSASDLCASNPLLAHFDEAFPLVPTTVGARRRPESVFASAMCGEILRAVPASLVRSDGSKAEVLVSAKALSGRDHVTIGCVVTIVDVTEARRAEKALQRSEGLLRTILETAPEPVFLKDAECRLVLANPATFEVIGKPPDQVLGKTDREYYDDPAVGQSINENDRRVMLSGKTEVIEEHALTRNGYRTYLSSKAPWRGPDGRILGIVGVTRDITERKDAERRTARQNAMLDGIARIFHEALTCRTEEELGGVCLAVAEEITQSRCGFVGLINRDTGMLELVALRQQGCAIRADEAAGGGSRGRMSFAVCGVYGRVILDAKPFFTNDPGSHPDSIGMPPGHPPLTAFLGVPLTAAGQVMGMIALANREDGYGTDELEAVQALAPAIVQAFASKQAELALSESREHFRAIAEWLPQLVFQVGARGEPEYFNHRWSAYTGGQSKTSEDWMNLVHPEDRSRTIDLWREAIRAHAEYAGEYRYRRHDGEYRWFLTRAFPVRSSSGEVLRWFGTATDIHELKAAQEALRQADRQKDEFLAVLSHELRNPLAPIANSLYVLKHAVPGGDQARRAQSVIGRQFGQLSRLVDDLLDVTRLSRNKIHLQCQTLDLNVLVRRTLDDYRSQFEKSGVRVELSLAPLPVLIHGDRNRLTQVIGNLFQNASKFTEPGGCTSIAVATDPTENRGVVRITDTGIGMDSETLLRLFQPFMQADKSLDRSKGGLGLGLALVRGLLELHGGRISAHSAGPGQGSEFVVRLPLSAPLSSSADADPSSDAKDRADGCRVLIIEDNVDAAESLKEVLELTGHEVVVSHNGRDGIDRARRYRPEVVLCDIGLPGMDGYDVARMFRSDDALKRTFLVALTGYALPEDLERAREAGFQGHLSKPPELDRLRELLQSAHG